MSLEDYLLTKKVGEGGAGAVYKAYDRRQGRIVAIKLTHHALGSRAAQLGSEANALHLEHPNILKLERLEQLQDGRLLLATPFVAGKSLEKLLIPLPFADALAIVAQVAEGLDYAHRQGVLHCDIKPANLMLAGGRVTILDFGLSRLLGNLAERPTGTLEYLSPEAARGQALGSGSDLWSLGVVFYELITGRTPFAAGSPATILRNIAEAEPPAPSSLRLGLPTGADVVVGRLLSRNQDERYGDAAALLRDLRAIEAGEPIAVPTGASKRTTAPARARLGGSLPSKPALLLGREDEVALLSLYLRDPDCRLVTLQGLGGVGKTHLGLWLSHEQDQFAHVHFAELAEVAQEGFLDALASLLGAAGGSGLGAVQEAIGERSQLLVLDNFEHLVSQAPLLEKLLGACPSLSILVTSRQRLGLAAEWVLPLRGLAVPKDPPPAASARSYGALALLEHRAKALSPSFDLLSDLKNAHRICAMFEGHPLGISLAAGLLGRLRVSEVAEGLEESFALPEQGGGRHRSLQAVFLQSYALLPPELQRSLGNLAVFEGGFEREAAVAVARADAEALARLLERSLLEQSLEGRYRQHPVIQGFCKDLPEAKDPGLWRRYQRFYLERLRLSSLRLKGSGRKEALEGLGREFANLRVVVQQQADLSADLAEPLRAFYTQRGRYLEGWRLFEGKGGSYAAVCAGWFALLLGELDEAETRSASASASQDAAVRLLALNTRAGVLARRNDLEEAKGASLAALELARQLRDRPMVGACLSNLALLSELQGGVAEAIGYYERSLELSQEHQDHLQTLTSLNNLAVLHLSRHEVKAAKALLERALVLAETTRLNEPGSIGFNEPGSIGLTRMRPMLQGNFGLCLYAQGEYANAEVAYLEAYGALLERGDKGTAARVQAYLGQSYRAQGDGAKAHAWLLGALRQADALDDAVGRLCALVRVAELVSEHDRRLAGALAALVRHHPHTEPDDRHLAERLSGGEAATAEPGSVELGFVVAALLEANTLEGALAGLRRSLSRHADLESAS